jgi:dienelactone hydrolase
MSINSVSKTSGSILSNNDIPIYYDLYIPSVTPGNALPVVLFVHGFKGFKDWGAFPDACEELARPGFAVISFNLSMNGVGESMADFDEPENFANQTLSQDLDDIGTVIEAIKSREIDSNKVNLDTDRMGIIGHSRGGHTAVAAAAEYSEIQCLVTWSAVSDYNERWSEKMKNDWNKNGYTEIENSRTGQVFKINKAVFDDAIDHADKLMAIKRINEIYIPSMFIAGKSDEAVPYSNSEVLFRRCPADEKEVRLIENTGHTFGVSHPFEMMEFPKAFEEVLDFTEGWLLEHLK